ncbi:hypothetical protein [Legionella cardiaca]|uniref:Substrate of the Dot/Icm secretion system n=1 Tax=Legionella cardiaca TaxID=1071983 RepID=A0ABY8AXD2_9GAMM|nr:hypothetical protein [Legionella cardiaca]WED44386.1 hypothetical protein PXX05_06250 [Legionella cardiaca]
MVDFPKIKNPFRDAPRGPDQDAFTKAVTDPLQQEMIENQKKIKERNSAQKNEKINKEIGELQKQVDENIQRCLKGESEAFVEWTTGMNKLMNYLKVFSELINKWLGNMAMANPNWDKIDQDKLNISPEIKYSVTMDETTGHVKSDVSVNGKPVTEEQKRLFDMALFDWAKKNGHTLQVDANDPDKRFTLTNDTTGQRLTDKSAFDDLKKDTSNGLQKTMHNYLSERFALKMEDQSDYQPSTPSGP